MLSYSGGKPMLRTTTTKQLIHDLAALIEMMTDKITAQGSSQKRKGKEKKWIFSENNQNKQNNRHNTGPQRPTLTGNSDRKSYSGTKPSKFQVKIVIMKQVHVTIGVITAMMFVPSDQATLKANLPKTGKPMTVVNQAGNRQGSSEGECGLEMRANPDNVVAVGKKTMMDVPYVQDFPEVFPEGTSAGHSSDSTSRFQIDM
ncbi:hypothetical protein Tco_1354284 [Tanacetum coccineum]